MKKPGRIKTAGANLPVPQNRDEASACLRRIGEKTREITRIEADMNDRLAAIRQEAERNATPLREQVEADTQGLKLWAEANRDTITNGNRVKYSDLGTGRVSWRLRPARVSIRGADTVIEAIKTLGWLQFLRTREEVNKEAMLETPDQARLIAGVSIGSEGEDFIVEPFEAAISGQ